MDKSNLLSIISKKKIFFSSIFLNLSVQLIITYLVMTNFKYTLTPIAVGCLFLLSLGLIISLVFTSNMPTFVRLIIMTCFSIATGILFSTLTKVKTTHAIQTAVLGSVVIFVCMFVFGLTLYAFGISLDSRIGIILLLILIGLILARFVQIFFYNRSQTYNKYVTWIALVLFSGFIIYDTNRILQPDYNRDFVMASMDYYLDIINLFVNMLGRN